MTIDKFYKTENIIKVTPEDTLYQTFSVLSSSHDAAFVVDRLDTKPEKEQFLGVINPYYCLIKKSYPANTKVKHCLIHPPKVDINYPLKKVARLMIDSKIHYLPVFSQEKFFGIISARRLLFAIKNTKALQKSIGSFLNHKKGLISVFEDDFISTALGLFKQYKISKLIVLSKDYKLKGILAYFDLISYLATPKERQHLGTREGNKISLLKRHVKNFMKSTVLTLTPSDSLSKAADLILEKQIGSVVIVNGTRSPIGIITTRDLLNMYIRENTLPKVELVTKSLSKKSWFGAKDIIAQLNNRITNLRDISRARIFIKEGKGVFQTIVALFLKDKKVKVIKKEGKNLAKVLQEVKDKAQNVQDK